MPLFCGVRGGALTEPVPSLRSGLRCPSAPADSGDGPAAWKDAGRLGRGRKNCERRRSRRGLGGGESASALGTRLGSSEVETSALNSSIENTGERCAIVAGLSRVAEPAVRWGTEEEEGVAREREEGRVRKRE